MSIGAMICSLIAIPFLLNKKMFVIGSLVATLLVSGLAISWNTVKPHVNDSGRFSHWTRIYNGTFKGIPITHVKTGVKTFKRYNLFGYGAGSFKNLYPKKVVKENFNKCHNEYLQLYFEFGIVFLILFILFLIYCLTTGYDIYTKSALICICLNALGLFVWQLGVTQFLSIYLLCLNKDV